MAEQKFDLATDADYEKFVGECKASDGWNLVHQDANFKIWDQKRDGSAINIVKLNAVFKDIPAALLYDVLHDSEYRAVWDDNMVEGFLIEQLDKHNDVGYYSAKAPLGVANRDWVNQRSWKEVEGKEFIIFNHSVKHDKQPEKKGFTRAFSILTGYYVVASEDGKGCSLTYLTQNDPKGWIPSWLTNWVTKTFAPKILTKLEKACQEYTAWKDKHNPEKKPWRD